MKKVLALLAQGFESSSYKTPEFLAFTKSFKAEFKKELATVGAILTDFRVGHFDLSGFFKKGEKIYYFSLSDVRGSEIASEIPLMYRTAKDNKDFTGGSNQWLTIRPELGETAGQMQLR